MGKDEVIGKIEQIARGISEVKDQYISEKGLKIDYITIFSHSNSEFRTLIKFSKKLGKRIDEHNGPVIKLTKPMKLGKDILKVFRIRKPDKQRPQIGCGDFKVKEYDSFKKKYLGRKNFELFTGEGFEFIGIHDPNSQFLVYFPSETLTEYLGL
ncbi:hypothetical protein JW766_01080 [Candidatus Dojkabacteria bacterium]|nr:hypothetical protein [Candidatus Dojkabacteria bacterium]